MDGVGQHLDRSIFSGSPTHVRLVEVLVEIPVGGPPVGGRLETTVQNPQNVCPNSSRSKILKTCCKFAQIVFLDVGQRPCGYGLQPWVIKTRLVFVIIQAPTFLDEVAATDAHGQGLRPKPACPQPRPSLAHSPGPAQGPALESGNLEISRLGINKHIFQNQILAWSGLVG